MSNSQNDRRVVHFTHTCTELRRFALQKQAGNVRKCKDSCSKNKLDFDQYLTPFTTMPSTCLPTIAQTPRRLLIQAPAGPPRAIIITQRFRASAVQSYCVPRRPWRLGVLASWRFLHLVAVGSVSQGYTTLVTNR